MDRRTATPDAASVAPGNDRRALRRAASSRRAGPATPGIISAGGSNGRRAAPHAASRRTAAPEIPDAVSAPRSFGRRTVPNRGHRAAHRATSAKTGHAMMGRAMMDRVPVVLAPMVLAPMVRAPAALGWTGRAVKGSHFRRVRVRTTVATEPSRTAATIARLTVPRRRTHRAARSGCMACTQLPPRSPTQHAACAAWC
jgi:hypothetical protein